MSKHCDFCMNKIDRDFRSVVIHRDYINPGYMDPEPRPELVKKTELCHHCNKHVSDVIGKVQNEIFETLDKGRQELLVRAGLEPNK